jgi:DNA-binding NtrC family response regulator
MTSIGGRAGGDHHLKGPAHVLVVDDEPAIRRSLARALLARGLTVDTAESGAAALDLLRTRAVDAVLLDREMPELDGLSVLAQLRQKHPDVEVVLMLSVGDPDTDAALRAGAYAVVTKPFPTPDAAVPAVERAAERRRLVERTRALSKQLAEHEQLGEIVGSSPRLVELVRRASTAAASSAPVLVMGERGTGKGLLARAVHRRSSRARLPLVVLAPGELGEDAVLSELAAALDAAEGGTLLIDDLGTLPRTAQVELSRALQQRPRRADVRMIATALPDLRDQVASGAFREDLFHGLAAVLLEVPPLRRRREDVPLLAYHFLARFAAREGKSIRKIAGEALKTLRQHDWPGNVGELQRTLEHAVVMARGEAILVADLPLRHDADAGEDDERDADDDARSDGEPPLPLIAGQEVLDLPYPEAKEQAMAAFDRIYVARRLELASGNVSEAARLAGMDRSNFRRLVKKARGREA